MTPVEAHPDHDPCGFRGDESGTFGMSPTGAPARGALELSELYQAWFPQVCRWVRSLGGPGIDAEDLTQEVFIVVQRKLAGFDRANLAGWLHRIADLTVRDHHRRAAFRRRSSQSRDAVLDEVVSATAGPHEQLAGKQREMHLCALIRRVNPRWRDSCLMFYVVGLSGEQVASLHGISAATVRTHLARGRREILALASRLSTNGGW